MLIFIENTPRAYAWGSRDALPELLGVAPTGEPQAELWLGDHPGAPATVAKARPVPQTLIDLIESDPGLYGVDGQHLPFLLKVLGIGAPLSLQVHPNKEQAEAGFAREEAAGVLPGSRERNYGDDNHKPELLVALSEVSALCGFRDLAAAREDFLALAAAAPEGAMRDSLLSVAERCQSLAGDDEARSEFLHWALGGGPGVAEALEAIEHVLAKVPDGGVGIDPARVQALVNLTATYPGDPGTLISVLLHLVTLQPGEAIYLSARQLHAYLCGIAVEVMAASDNVLRAGFTQKHIDVDEVLRIVDTSQLDTPRIFADHIAPGLVTWAPAVPEFALSRARLGDPAKHLAFDEPSSVQIDHESPNGEEYSEPAESVIVAVPYPTVLVVVSGRVRVERVGGELSEVASAGRGQSLYVSAGEDIELTGVAEVFIATVGTKWSRVSKPSSAN
ncbi:mannose-6-phosphate isomerase, class I [Leucobacter sp. UT-8R-CII-1-4]|uniref:mannose-6-phosphate isomerase, class I n=1 Tax=Leucobacter sp. UT-8R-CII-1-4 TaxID=3040075 RepID=UPI0024A8CD31|nr:mannose-6-phosphate isomerase, class I [Leucobacter sp. UT-8R-CII-1-4]MDI6023774.1 mannose-6-phosphate isomerase, class I [Leucobacter sp. UT-8R-CII-1-4]